MDKFEELRSYLPLINPPDQLKFIKLFIANLPSAAERDAMGQLIELIIAGIAIPPKPKVVVLIHGIRTQGQWFRSLSQSITSHPNFKVEECKYGYLDALRFWCPIYFRGKVVNKVLKTLKKILDQNSGSDFYLVAHSFGTYISCEIMQDCPEIRFKKAIFCGSIVNEDFRWDKLRNEPEILVNECGTKDCWPVMAKVCSLGFGASGRFGFNMNSKSNRYHDLDHGGFFDDSFYLNYWVPFLVHDQIVVSEWDKRRPTENWFIQLLGIIPGLLLWLILLILTFIFLLYLAP